MNQHGCNLAVAHTPAVKILKRALQTLSLRWRVFLSRPAGVLMIMCMRKEGGIIPVSRRNHSISVRQLQLSGVVRLSEFWLGFLMKLREAP